jgi:carbon-monoxide dehydrogenase large subunit
MAPPMKRPERKALAIDKVRFVGDPVAMVVARTPFRRAMPPRPSRSTSSPARGHRCDEAIAQGAPQLYDDVPGNMIVDYHFGDAAKVAAAFAAAAHVTKLRIVNNRVVVNPIEPRAAIASFDRLTGGYTLHAPSQGAFGMRNNLAASMGVAQDKMRVLTGHVGGSFGMKASVFPNMSP